MMKQFLKQTIVYSLITGILALISPVAVAAQSVKSVKALNLYGIDTAGGVKSLNLYGVNTGRIAATATGLNEIQVAVIILSIIVGVILVANGRFLKKALNN